MYFRKCELSDFLLDWYTTIFWCHNYEYWIDYKYDHENYRDHFQDQIFKKLFHIFFIENHVLFAGGRRGGRVASHGKSKSTCNSIIMEVMCPLVKGMGGRHEPKSNSSTCDYIKCKSLYLTVKMILSAISMIVFVISTQKYNSTDKNQFLNIWPWKWSCQ